MDRPAQTIKTLRRINARYLANSIGGNTHLSRRLACTPGQISHLIGARASRNIGDKLAAKIEQSFALLVGWLDRPHLNACQEFPYLSDFSNFHYVPLLTDQQVLLWLQKPQAVLSSKTVGTHVHLTRQAYAIRSHGSALGAGQHIMIPRGSILIAEPPTTIKHADYLLIHLPNTTHLQLTQYIQSNGRSYLKPNNSHHPTIDLPAPHCRICGVVRQAMIEL